ncbi:MAG: protein phosphatase 2C domain-containing protein [Chloroflexi bacterium]|nr:protein phosphatase 2C domain-containing protein [Chloroflexota bacterium]MCI0649691.1 protein phosphatase 2C domain-containing protein [Chloroflexota bacterium]MCI0729946.1 protein phosphatase 2C domain-containing protein [Chloroflexota bacterium]
MAEKGLFILSDGMGGHRAGDVAARRVVERLPAALEEEIGGLLDKGQAPAGEAIRQAMQRATAQVSAQIYAEGCQDPERYGMGATVVLALLLGRQAHILHLGDSRAYLWRGGRLRQLTEDHTVGAMLLQLNQVTVEDVATKGPLQRLLRCMGMAGDAKADVYTVALKAGDRLLLCSDGLNKMVEEGEIGAIVGREAAPERACRELIAAANAAGGQDNISAIVVAVDTIS